MHVPLVFFLLLRHHTVNLYFSIMFLMIVFLLMLKNVNIKNICTCKVVVFSFFQPNCNKVFCFYTQMHLFVSLLRCQGNLVHSSITWRQKSY